MKTVINQQLPKEQVQILIDALQNYQESIEKENIHVADEQAEAWLNFDINTLKALLQHDVHIQMPIEKYESFTSDNGIDFPEYNIKTIKLCQ